jgi:transcriptional regulator with XRE-family HTH domain
VPSPRDDSPALAGDGFGAALSRALEERGLSMVALQRRLGDRGHAVSVSALSYWRSGQRLPEKPASLDAVREIEVILGLDPGTLTGRIGPSRRPGPRPPQVEDGHSAPAEVGVPEALRELGLGDLGQDMRGVAVQVTLDVDAEGQMTRQTVRTLLRATTEGAQRWFHVIFTEQELAEPLVLAEVTGVEVGKSYVRSEVGLFVWELVLARPLAVGETALIETRTELVDLGNKDTSYFHHLDRRTPAMLIWVRFDPSAAPRRCVQTLQELDGTAVDTPMELGGLNTAHVAARSFGPGRIGLTWEW